MAGDYMPHTRHIQHTIESGYITITGADDPFPAFWAHPHTRDQYPGLVILHDSWGLTAYVRNYVRLMAEAGFYVIAPDLFDGQVADSPQKAAHLIGQMGVKGTQRMAASLQVLKQHNHCNGRASVLGWEVGGELSFHAAMFQHQIEAAVVFYGQPNAFIPLIPNDITPILCFYGSDDPLIPPTMLASLQQALTAAPAENRLIIYPHVQTGFCNPNLTSYNPSIAQDAWERSLNFLKQHLSYTS